MTLVIIFSALAIVFDIMLLFIISLQMRDIILDSIKRKRLDREIYMGTLYVFGTVANASLVTFFVLPYLTNHV